MTARRSRASTVSTDYRPAASRSRYSEVINYLYASRLLDSSGVVNRLNGYEFQ